MASLLNRDLKKVRKGVFQIPGERALQAEGGVGAFPELKLLAGFREERGTGVARGGEL